MENLVLVIFGITGNLAQLKLIPVLYDMAAKGLLPDEMIIVGIARKPLSDKEIKDYIKETLRVKKGHEHEIKEEIFEDLVKKIRYINGYADDPNFYPYLKEQLASLSPGGSNRIFYLATYPELYEKILGGLQSSNLNKQEKGWVRLMIEKPLGNDLPSAQKLNNLLTTYFSEDQIYRIDHYLGKETIQNILTFRFGNGIFEHLINRDFIDHIQITSAENFGIGNRGSFYDKVGALKDVGQNHLLQMLAFTVMDAPTEFTNRAVTDERIKILQKLIPFPEDVVFGQYEGYKSEPNVEENSITDTFFALKTKIDNERFKNVPIYIRAGKNLNQTVTEISVVFKVPENRLFKELDCGDEPNALIYRVQPNEGIVLRFLAKKPGHEIKLDPTYMQFCYKQDPHFVDIPDPYERLLMDTIRGDQTFFNDAEEVEAQWKFVDPLSFQNKGPIIYKVGSWGPKEADDLIAKDGRIWLEPSPEFCSII